MNFKMGLYKFSTTSSSSESVSSTPMSKSGDKEIKPNSSEKEYYSFLKWFVGFTDAVYSNRRKYSTTKTSVNNLVVWGTNLQSTVGERFSRKQLATVRLTPYTKGVIVGLILSDGWLIISNSKNARLGFSQSGSHSEYFWFVFSLLSHYCSSYPTLRNRSRLGKQTIALQFLTRLMPCLTELHTLFYPNKVKVIPSNIYDLLTPVALAHLIMGDGGFKSKGIYICTDSYSIQDVVRLMNALILRYDLKCTLHKASNSCGYRIYISRNSVWKVKEIVKPYLVPSMYYKLGEEV